MENAITLRGKIKDKKTIELESELLNDWNDQKVFVSIKKDKKAASTVKTMLDEMRKGKNIGYNPVNRNDIYRV
jgi:uncharacterized HAD superfamily protein